MFLHRHVPSLLYTAGILLQIFAPTTTIVGVPAFDYAIVPTQPPSCRIKNSSDGAPPPVIRTTFHDRMTVPSCHCDRASRKCHSIIEWEQPEGKGKVYVSGYRLKFQQDEKEQYKDIR